MDIEVHRDGDVGQLVLAGELDLSSADDLRATAAQLLDEAPCSRLMIDLSGVVFVDSTGVGALVELRNATAQRGSAFVLADPSPRVREVLRLTAMDSVFDIVDRPPAD